MRGALLGCVATCILATSGIAPAASPIVLPVSSMTRDRRAAEATFMRSVRPNQTANDLTSDIPAHTGEHVAYTCAVDEETRPGVIVGNCGTDDEPVDLYIKVPGRWRVGERFRVFGIMDTPASWSDVGGHTVYYPFVRAVFVDRLPKGTS